LLPTVPASKNLPHDVQNYIILYIKFSWRKKCDNLSSTAVAVRPFIPLQAYVISSCYNVLAMKVVLVVVVVDGIETISLNRSHQQAYCATAGDIEV
jgi:hypothetical protein